VTCTSRAIDRVQNARELGLVVQQLTALVLGLGAGDRHENPQRTADLVRRHRPQPTHLAVQRHVAMQHQRHRAHRRDAPILVRQYQRLPRQLSQLLGLDTQLEHLIERRRAAHRRSEPSSGLARQEVLAQPPPHVRQRCVKSLARMLLAQGPPTPRPHPLKLFDRLHRGWPQARYRPRRLRATF
jgi:hypothetical protein